MNAREPEHDYVTRADLAALEADLIRELASKAEVERLRADVTAAIAGLDSRTNSRIGGLESRIGGLESRIGGLESRISGPEATLRTFMWSAGVVGAIVVAAALKTLFGW